MLLAKKLFACTLDVVFALDRARKTATVFLTVNVVLKMNSNPNNNNCAKQRWVLLRKAIINKSIPSPRDIPVSKRSFERFHQLLEWSPDSSSPNVMRVGINRKYTDKKYEVWVHYRDGAKYIDITGLNGFDRTGRLCIWPSEQILGFWCARNLSFFKGKSVIEIGGGFHCFAGLLISKFSEGSFLCSECHCD